MPNDITISEREREILRLVATGASNQQIAQQLSISINTVKVHLRNIFSKIDVVSRTEATVYAISNGLVTVATGEAVDPVAAEAPALAAPDDAVIAQIALSDLEPPPAEEVMAPLVALPDPAAPRRSLPPLSVLLAVGVGVAVLAALVILGMRAAGGQPAPPPAAPTAAASAAALVSPDQRWFTRAPMINSRDGFALAAYDPERKLYVIGGRRGGSVSAAVDRYDPASDRWVSLAEKSTAVSDAGAIMLQGDIYVPGGEDANGRVRDVLEIYNPRDQQWERGSPMPAPRSRYALVAWEGRLYVIGGWDGQRARSEVFIYNPELKTWSEGPSLLTPRQGAGAITAAGRIYLIGGSNEGGALRESLRLDPTAEGAFWERIAPLPDQGVPQPGVVAPVDTILVFDSDQRRGFQYDQASDTWADFAIPDGVTISSKAVLLGPSIYLIDAGAAPSLGTMSEYQAVYTIFIPSR